VWIVVAACWGLLVVAWLAGALYNARRGPETHKRAYSGGAWFAGVVVAALLATQLPSGSWRPEVTSKSWLAALGTVVLVVSTAFTLWARAVLGTMWASKAVLKADHVLHTKGPYGVTRHPIYTGVLGMLAGSALITGLGRWTALLLVAFVVFHVKIRAEERLLKRAFRDRYPQYRRDVPRLIPRRRARHSRPAP
jgi:protein-S-isoprenylcysteine O-methyltransferase Ste14